MFSGAKGKVSLYGVLGLLLIAVISWFLILSPRLSTAGEIQGQADVVVAENTNAQTQLAGLEQLAADAPNAAKRAQELFTKMPQKADIPAVIEQFTAAATAAGITQDEIISLTPGQATPISTEEGSASLPGMGVAGASIAEIPITMSVDTSSDKFLAFLGNLEALDRIFIISGLSLAESDEGSVNSTVQGKLYLLQSELPDLVQQVNDLIAASGADIPVSTDGATGTTPAPSGSAAPVPSGSAAPLPGASAAPSGSAVTPAPSASATPVAPASSAAPSPSAS